MVDSATESSAIRQRLQEGLKAWIATGSEVALIDVPVNRNAGDLFILAAADRMLSDLECETVYRAGVRDYRSNYARRQVGSKTTIICLGGGNFGDLYPQYQALRERVVADFASNPVVVLPQSVYFASDAEAVRSASILARHGDLRIAVRDRRSLDLVRSRITPQVQLLPDLVHWVQADGVKVAPSANKRTVALMRRDSERASESKDLSTDAPQEDWPQLLPGYTVKVAVAAARMSAVPLPMLGRQRHEKWALFAHRLLDQAIDRLRVTDRVVTDRLHGAIVARLGGVPVDLVDNSYGKLSAYYDAWWRGDPAVRLGGQDGRAVENATVT